MTWRPSLLTTSLVGVLLIASALRLYHLGQSSLWYDEVVTMRLARTESPRLLLRLLDQIDATRAPLHPLVLQGWLKLFGPSDYSGRASSALCGMITIGLVYWIGLRAVDGWTGLWAAWLCSLSPLLVYYSREARMYMWLVLVTCLAWGFLLSHARSPQPWRLVLYGLSLIAIVYSHPLGLLMAGTLGLASNVFRRAYHVSWRAWLYIHFVVALAIAPWLRHYLDHAPESTTGLLPIQYLFGMPIGFIGGNSLVLLFCTLLIVYGLCQVERRSQGRIKVVFKPGAQSISLLIWLVVPPLLLYCYSLVSHPIFGPARYTLFVGPAYLLLVARGLSKLPWSLGIVAAVAGAIFSATMLVDDVYRSDRYTDWRSAAAYLDQRELRATVAVITGSLFGNTELETARYYFGPHHVVIPWIEPPDELMSRRGPLWVSINLQDGHPMVKLPTVLTTGKLVQEVVDFSRVRLMRVNFHQTSAPEK
jgi:mannosyltransferase